MNHELQQIDNEQFGQMINLPTILNENRASTSGATLAVNKLIEEVEKIDIAKADIQALDAIDEKLITLQTKIVATVKKQEDKRKPYTGFFDSVRALFTAEEKAVGTLGNKLTEKRTAIAARKLQDQRKADAEKQKAVDKKNEEIRIRTCVKDQIAAYINNALFDAKQELHSAFYAADLAHVQKWEENVKNVPPLLKRFDYSNFRLGIINFHDTEERLKIIHEEFTESFKDVEFLESYREYAAEILSLKHSRIIELQKIATDTEAAEKAKQRQEFEAQQLKDQFTIQEQNNKQLHQADATAQQLEATFDIIAAAPIIEQSKGIKVKQKYKADSHAAHIAIMQWWTANILPTMSVEDLNVKLSFMRTAADKSLNEGNGSLVANGLTIIDDIKTRTR